MATAAVKQTNKLLQLLVVVPCLLLLLLWLSVAPAVADDGSSSSSNNNDDSSVATCLNYPFRIVNMSLELLHSRDKMDLYLDGARKTCLRFSAYDARVCVSPALVPSNRICFHTPYKWFCSNETWMYVTISSGVSSELRRFAVPTRLTDATNPSNNCNDGGTPDDNNNSNGDNKIRGNVANGVLEVVVVLLPVFVFGCVGFVFWPRRSNNQ